MSLTLRTLKHNMCLPVSTYGAIIRVSMVKSNYNKKSIDENEFKSISLLLYNSYSLQTKINSYAMRSFSLQNTHFRTNGKMVNSLWVGFFLLGRACDVITELLNVSLT